jgi:phosphoribosylamine--glycine ligase
MRIAVLGSGGREHAISWKLQQSADKVFCLPGNGGTTNNVDIDPNNFDAVKEFCHKEEIELLFVGPEAPLAKGIVDYFSEYDIKVFGPDREAAKLESSKIFAKKFMQKYKVATAKFHVADSKQKAVKVIEKMNGNCVLKYDGLAGGKGVYVCSNMEEATQAVAELYEKYGADANLLVEEKLEGKELSILAFTDGQSYQLLLPSQDHKQLLEGDKGPNTGGMGAFCPVPFYNEELKKQIEQAVIEPTMQGIRQENFNYHGVLYFGLMITADGPKVLEYNVRLGDPETEVVLPALKSDLKELVLACFDGSLADFEMEFNDRYFVDVVLVSGGYPQAYQKGKKINGISDLEDLVFHAGTKFVDDGWITSGGRVLNVVDSGETLAAAIQNTYKKIQKYSFEDMFYRKDIGNRAGK